MTPITPSPLVPVLTEAVFALTLALLFLAPLAIAGVALINVGLGRSRSAAQSLLGNLALLAVSVIVFALVGATLAGAPGAAGHSFQLAGKPWNWLGAGPLFLGGLGSASPQAQLTLLFEFLAVALAVMIPWGSGADRFRLTAGCAAAAVLAALVFPLAAHWIWGYGWLAQLGVNFGLGAGFLDGGGAATVHLLGGLSALAVVWIAGPRRGKFPKEGLSTALPGHNAVYVLFGCLVALVGWLAWNAAGAVIFLHASLAALPVTALNTLLSASGALAATFAGPRRLGRLGLRACRWSDCGRRLSPRLRGLRRRLARLGSFERRRRLRPGHRRRFLRWRGLRGHNGGGLRPVESGPTADRFLRGGIVRA